MNRPRSRCGPPSHGITTSAIALSVDKVQGSSRLFYDRKDEIEHKPLKDSRSLESIYQITTACHASPRGAADQTQTLAWSECVGKTTQIGDQKTCYQQHICPKYDHVDTLGVLDGAPLRCNCCIQSCDSIALEQRKDHCKASGQPLGARVAVCLVQWCGTCKGGAFCWCVYTHSFVRCCAYPVARAT